MAVQTIDKNNPTVFQFPAEPTLSAVGATQALDVTPYSKITCFYTIASIGSNVVVRLEGSDDGVRWGNLSPTETDTTKTQNGTYSFVLQGIALYRIRFNFVSFSGGTPNINVRFLGIN
ncbi:hypothetical protein [Scytonema sp. NUACC26]|uniref:hypothetical protein n=1 Tax=Scytonema sp. NUACC26 TaxID=3140176 RepID=UPI0034DB86AF